jgi:hypothetical protein
MILTYTMTKIALCFLASFVVIGTVWGLTK